jgi:hypothetical protein
VIHEPAFRAVCGSATGDVRSTGSQEPGGIAVVQILDYPWIILDSAEIRRNRYQNMMLTRI